MKFQKFTEYDALNAGFLENRSESLPHVEPIPVTSEEPPGPSAAVKDLKTDPGNNGILADAQEKQKKHAQFLRLAREAYMKGEYLQAIKLFSELPGPGVDALSGKGASYFKLGNYRDAIACLKKADELHNGDFNTLKFLAFAYYKVDEVQKSCLTAEKALSIREDSELKALYTIALKEEKVYRTYVEENTRHFKVLFDGYEHGSIEREIVSILEDAYRHVGKELDYFPSSPVTVIMYTDRDFHDTTRAPGWSGGIFDGKIRIPVKGAAPDNPFLKKVLFHEYSHAVVHSLAPGCPLWIQEGLSEYFSQSSPPGKTARSIPLNRLEQPFSRLSDTDVPLAYAESYLAVSYLIDKSGMFRFKKLLISLSLGKDINTSFSEAFGLTYDDFVSLWGHGIN